MRYPQRKSYSSHSHRDMQNPKEVPDSIEETKPSLSIPKSPPTGAKLRGIAFAMLGRREHSEQEFRQKLLDLDADPDEVAELIKEFKTSQYQSDQRMAEMIVRANIRKGRGPVRVKQTLRERSVDIELAQENLADTDWLTLARTLRSKKFGVELPTDPKEKARQLRFLQYRGFDMQTCTQAISSHELDK